MFVFGGQPSQFSLMGMMTVPIAPWANKDIKARIKGIDYKLQAFEWDKAALANQIKGALADRLVMMQTLHEQINRYETDIIPNQHKRFQATLLAYEQNTDELFMTLDSWLELKMSRLSQLDLLQQLLQANVAYERDCLLYTSEYTSAYVCPMHCKGSGSDTTGTCPVCGMDYVPSEDTSHQEHNQ